MSDFILAGLALLVKVYAALGLLWLLYLLYAFGWYVMDWFRNENSEEIKTPESADTDSGA